MPPGRRSSLWIQETFEGARQYDALFQSLENELAYLRQAQQKDLAQLAHHRLNNLMAY